MSNKSIVWAKEDKRMTSRPSEMNTNDEVFQLSYCQVLKEITQSSKVHYNTNFFLSHKASSIDKQISVVKSEILTWACSPSLPCLGLLGNVTCM